MAETLRIEGLAKRYGAVPALEPTMLEVAAGEFLTLLGPSGSGKTTLLMMVAGLVEPSAGRLLLGGMDVTALPPWRRDIGVVFQSYALFPHLTVFENVAFPLRMRRRSEPEVKAAVARALDLVRLPHLAARLPRELSGGQQQRVAFARAVVFSPAIILMDEPLGALDRRLRDELKLEIRRLHRDLGATILYVTHDQEEAMLLSDRICLMNHARVAQLGPPKALYERPESRFAAEFLGEGSIFTATAGIREVRAGAVVLRTAHAARLPPPGEPIDVLVRPERVTLTAEPGAPQGEVVSLLDLGGTLQVTVTLENGPALRATLLGRGTAPVVMGQRVGVAIAPEDVVPLPRDR